MHITALSSFLLAATSIILLVSKVSRLPAELTMFTSNKLKVTKSYAKFKVLSDFIGTGSEGGSIKFFLYLPLPNSSSFCSLSL